LFAKFTQSSLLDFWKSRFCDSDAKYPTCERYKLGQRGAPVPVTLMPNGSQLGR
jgi:hypothetical protein